MPIPDNRTFWDHSRLAFEVHSAKLPEEQIALKRLKTRPKKPHFESCSLFDYLTLRLSLTYI